jgi:hypothetical protein
MMLTVAMADAKRQAKLQNNAPRTPKKPKLPVRPLIGSSSTWKQEELDRFKVECRSGVDPKLLIPAASFNFDNLGQYQISKSSPLAVLTKSTSTACFYRTFRSFQ